MDYFKNIFLILFGYEYILLFVDGGIFEATCRNTYLIVHEELILAIKVLCFDWNFYLTIIHHQFCRGLAIINRTPHEVMRVSAIFNQKN